MENNKEKATNVAKILNDFIKSTNKVYKLLGLKYLREVYSLGRFPKVEGNPKPVLKSVEELSKGQVGLFQNLNNLRDPDLLDSFVNEFRIIPNGENPKGIAGADTLLMAEERYDSLGRKVITKYQVYFREYTEQEEQEYLSRLASADASSLGYGTGPIAKLDLF